MPKFKIVLLLLIFQAYGFTQVHILDSISKVPVSYATISFGNGNGIFADDEGKFVFNKKLYPDIDTLYISALGYKEKTVIRNLLEAEVLLQPKVDELEEVVINYELEDNRAYDIEELEPYLDDDYHNCWLPTIESEIAVYFPNPDKNEGKVSSVLFPIALESKDWEKRNKKNSDKKKFSTLFKVKFYSSKDGLPHEELTYKTIVFRATEKDGDFYELDVNDYSIKLPQDGLFVSLQVLGYTDANGKLLPNKKYKEIKTRDGTVKIPTNFRPLLPFTDKIESHNTYIKRVFINKNEWTLFKKGYGFKSSLLDKGLYNYGIGLTLKLYKNE